MSRRNKQRRKKESPSKLRDGEQSGKLPPPNPPRPNVVLLIVSLVLMISWLLVLAALAVIG